MWPHYQRQSYEMQERVVFESPRAVKNAILWHMKSSHFHVCFREPSEVIRFRVRHRQDKQAWKAEPMVAGVRKPPESIENAACPRRGTGYAPSIGSCAPGRGASAISAQSGGLRRPATIGRASGASNPSRRRQISVCGFEEPGETVACSNRHFRGFRSAEFACKPWRDRT